MKVNYFSIPEITVSYKDNVKASERFVVKCSEDASQIFAEAHKDSMEHHEEVNVLFLNRANRVIGISCVSKGGLDGTVVDIRIILQTALKANCSVSVSAIPMDRISGFLLARFNGLLFSPAIRQ